MGKGRRLTSCAACPGWGAHRKSFESIRNWVAQIQQHADVHVNKILIANKCDMNDRRVVSVEEVRHPFLFSMPPSFHRLHVIVYHSESRGLLCMSTYL